jgi:hypothetical protein
VNYPFRDAFAQALDGRLFDIGYLDCLIGQMKAQVWYSDNAAIVTEIKEYPKARVIEGLIAAGDLGEIVNILIPKAEDWGRSIGCTLAMIQSRPGWARQLKSHGYATHQVSIAKEL